MNTEKGITIYLALLTLSAALATALYVATAHVSEFKTSQEAQKSLKAVYAADSAVELALFESRKNVFSPSDPLYDSSVWSTLQAKRGSTIIPLFTADSFSPTTKFNVGASTCSSLIPATLSASCDIKVNTNVTNAENQRCPLSATSGCTQITSTGQYGSGSSAINRAIEIMYANQ